MLQSRHWTLQEARDTTLTVEAHYQIVSMSGAGEVRASVFKEMSALAETFEAQVVSNEALGVQEKA